MLNISGGDNGRRRLMQAGCMRGRRPATKRRQRGFGRSLPQALAYRQNSSSALDWLGLCREAPAWYEDILPDGRGPTMVGLSPGSEDDLEDRGGKEYRRFLCCVPGKAEKCCRSHGYYQRTNVTEPSGCVQNAIDTVCRASCHAALIVLSVCDPPFAGDSGKIPRSPPIAQPSLG